MLFYYVLILINDLIQFVTKYQIGGYQGYLYYDLKIVMITQFNYRVARIGFIGTSALERCLRRIEIY